MPEEREPAPSSHRELLREARDALIAHATHREYDYPGDDPVDCGQWCDLCDQHVEDDHGDHKASCPIARLASTTQLRWETACGATFAEMQDNARRGELYKRGDIRLVWVNEADLYPLASTTQEQTHVEKDTT